VQRPNYTSHAAKQSRTEIILDGGKETAVRRCGMSKLLITFFVTRPFLTGAAAQTASELADRYTHHGVYEVQPGVQMTAKFASNGLVCEMLKTAWTFATASTESGSMV
jgi:hypothetical protein